MIEQIKFVLVIMDTKEKRMVVVLDVKVTQNGIGRQKFVIAMMDTKRIKMATAKKIDYSLNDIQFV